MEGVLGAAGVAGEEGGWVVFLAVVSVSVVVRARRSAMLGLRRNRAFNTMQKEETMVIWLAWFRALCERASKRANRNRAGSASLLIRRRWCLGDPKGKAGRSLFKTKGTVEGIQRHPYLFISLLMISLSKCRPFF